MGGRTKRTIRTKGNCLEVNVEILVFDNLLGPAVLVVGVTIGASSTYLTRQGVDGRVDGGVGDADVKDRIIVIISAIMYSMYQASKVAPLRSLGASDRN